MLTFRHAGDLGDIIYCLPSIQHLGGGALLLEESTLPISQGGARVPLSMAHAAPLLPLLLSQPYITSVSPWRGEPVDVNFNLFRHMVLPTDPAQRNFIKRMNLAHVQALVAAQVTGTRVPLPEVYELPWLHGIEPLQVAPVLFARSSRYHNPAFPWQRIIQRYGRQAAFVGLEQEHKAFCQEFACKIPWYPSADLLIAARAIAGCKLFVGGQSCLYPIAEGLKKDAILEIAPQYATNQFFRMGVIHGWDQTICLPDV